MTIKIRRPSDYRPEYCDVVMELSEQGKHVYQMAKELRCSIQTLYNWADKHPEFLDAFTCARAWSKGALMDRVDGMMTNPDAQPKLVELKATFLTDVVPVHAFKKLKGPKEQLEKVTEQVLNAERSGHSGKLFAEIIEKMIKADQDLELRPLLEQLLEKQKEMK